MAMKQDTFPTICDCENKVHEAFKRHSTDQQDLGDALGAIQTEFGKEAFLATIEKAPYFTSTHPIGDVKTTMENPCLNGPISNVWPRN